MYLISGHRVSADMPAERRLCGRCAAAGVADRTLTAAEADVLLAHVPVPVGFYALVTLLREGPDDVVARRLGVSVRTVSRRVAAAMRDVGARTRFDFGYLAALREAAGTV